MTRMGTGQGGSLLLSCAWYGREPYRTPTLGVSRA